MLKKLLTQLTSSRLTNGDRLLIDVALGFAVVAIAFGLGVKVIPSLILSGTDHFAAVVTSTLVDLTNLDRDAASVARLKVNPLLAKAAGFKAQDMASKGYFAHISPDGTTPWHWFAVAGYDYADAGENLAIDYFESADVEKAWMNSPFHRANIVNPSYTEVGIATSTMMYMGRSTTIVVQLFGRPVKKTARAYSTQTIVASTPTFMAVTTQK